MHNFYDKYYKNRKIQQRVIENKNYTYRYILKSIDPFLKKKIEVLDIGCGVGTVDFYLARNSKLVTGVDYSYKAINIAKLNAEKLGISKNLKFYQKKFPEQKIPGKYDMVLCLEVLEHLKNDKFVAEKIKNLLSKNGIAFFSVPSLNSPLYKLGLAKWHDERVGHQRRYTAEALAALVKTSGLKIIKVEKKESVLRNILFSFPLFSIMVRVANRFSIISDILTFFDNILSVFGEGQIILVAKKI